MPRVPQSLSRTSSSTSLESLSDDATSNSTTSSTRRSRKRFSNVQLMMLESLFHQSSHPSREERDTVAKAGSMEPKSVTIWFQNKRQMERKAALQQKVSIDNALLAAQNTSSFMTSPISPLNSSLNPSFISGRPSLDHFASLSESRISMPRTPQQPRRPRPESSALWDMMPSSPIAPTSPPARAFVEFGKLKRSHTLEWACARERLNIKESGDSREDEDDSDFEVVPVVTRPPVESHSWASGDVKWSMTPGGRMKVLNKGIQDDELLGAALALCGLSGSR
ncbi:homeodomain transcription factor [Mycena floridula]|nr:homeodomain transcription factor [Mycena floridula]